MANGVIVGKGTRQVKESKNNEKDVEDWARVRREQGILRPDTQEDVWFRFLEIT